MSRPLSLSGRNKSQRTNAVEYPITRKKSGVADNESGHNNINNSDDHNYDYDYDDTHPLPAPPAPAHSRFDPLQGYEQVQEQEREQEQGQDEPQSLQFVNSSGRINNSNRNNSATAKQQQGQQSDNLSDSPPPLPSKKTFYSMHPEKKDHTYSYNYRPPTSPPTFLDAFMSRHPKISRHRRRFAALIFTIVTILLLTIVLLAVLLTHKGDDGGFNGNGSIGGGGHNNGGLGQPGNEWGDGATATAEALRKHNTGISPAPINHSNAPGWTSLGKGEGTFYDPSIMNGAGQFQMGACEFPYINSAMDMIAALNKPDFGNFARASTSPACGQCLQVTGPNGTVTVQVVDMCPGCKSGDVDLTPGAFAKIARLDDGRVRISWRRC